MLTMTKKAKQRMEENGFTPALPLRVRLSPRGCTFPKVVVTQETPTTEDAVFSVAGYTLFLEKAVLSLVESVELDIMYGEFFVHTGRPYRAKGCGFCPAAAVNGGECGKAYGSGDIRHM